MADDKNGRTERIGYGRPPEHSRFRRGQSGNPAGRPKRAPQHPLFSDQPTLDLMGKIADENVVVREGGQSRQMSIREAVLRATIASASKGNSRSQQLLLDGFQTADARKARDIRELNDLWSDYKSAQAAALVAAKAKGKPAPSVIPHPDDIIIDPRRGPQFLGPLNAEEQARLDHTLRLRDVLIMQDALDQRLATRSDRRPMQEPGAALLEAQLLERAIPPRLRLSDTEWLYRMLKYDRVPKRELLKHLFAAWKEIGMPRPRGYLSPGLGHARDWFDFAFDLLADCMANDLDVTEIAERIQDYQASI